MHGPAGDAPSIALPAPQTRAPGRFGRLRDAIERWLEAERDQLALWLPVALGTGVGAWFALPEAAGWRMFLFASGALGLIAAGLGRGGRLLHAVAWFALVACLGCALAWGRSAWVAAPVLTHATVTDASGRIEAVEPLPAREAIRLTLALVPAPGLPPRARITLDAADAPVGLLAGAQVAGRMRLVPPPTAAVPGAYDYARVAWFWGVGASGKVLGPLRVTAPAPPRSGWNDWLDRQRARLTTHIESGLAGSVGGVAAAFITGDTGAITQEDAEAMRRSGLAHLLSISGLHVAAAIGATMWLTLRLLALWPRLALRWPLTLIAAAAGALAGIAYTLLSGAQVPTVRSCVASLLVLGGIALGREAMTLRLVATGALIVLLVRPEALVGPSFQLSFAAVAAIVALYEHPRVRTLALKRDEPLGRRLLREGLALLATGMVVEAALAPIALYHFHRDGLYGAGANIVAIPLSTFVIMPAEALALLLDLVGLGAPAWWVAGKALALLLWLARTTAALPGAVQTLPSMPLGAFLLLVAGGLWLALWRTRTRWLGLAPFAAGALWALLTPTPEILVTGDGRHLAVRAGDGTLRLLRPRAGDYVRDLLGWGAGIQADALDLDAMPGARCSVDTCVAQVTTRAGPLRLVATRTPYRLDRETLAPVCGWADVAVSDRHLPGWCRPRWLKLDAAMLGQTGGIALAGRRVTTVNGDDRHPWVQRAAPRAPFHSNGRRAYRPSSTLSGTKLKASTGTQPST